MKDSLQLADILTNIGGSYFNLKDYPKALAHFSEGLVIAQKISRTFRHTRLCRTFADEPET
jgi:two-component system NarL family sensor kinase